MLGIAILIIPFFVSYYVYKNANENGRNGAVWALINFVATFGIQIVFGIALAAIWLLIGWKMESLQFWSLFLNLIGVGLSLFVSYLIFRHVTLISDEAFRESPPPPPNFD